MKKVSFQNGISNTQVETLEAHANRGSQTSGISNPEIGTEHNPSGDFRLKK